MSAHGGPDEVTSGLVLALDAADIKSYPRTGTVWYDRSGLGNNGTLVNGVGYSNGAMVFDGVNDYIQKTTIENDSLDMRSALSFSIWIFVESGGSNLTYIFSKNLNSGYIDQQIACTWEGNKVRFIIGGEENLITTDNSIPLNEWVHITGTWTGTKRSLFINSKLNIEGNFSGVVSFKPNFQIGWRSSGLSTHYFKGKISNLILYNRALSPEEILQNYNANKSRFGLS